MKKGLKELNGQRAENATFDLGSRKEETQGCLTVGEEILEQAPLRM